MLALVAWPRSRCCPGRARPRPRTGERTAGPPGSAGRGAGRAKLVHGQAIAPSDAPTVAMRPHAHRRSSANRIDQSQARLLLRRRPLRASSRSCYDCSGSVSYALHGGRLAQPRRWTPSGLDALGHGQPGKWITVYANPGHAYMVVAGLRFDTSMTAATVPAGAAHGLGRGFTSVTRVVLSGRQRAALIPAAVSDQPRAPAFGRGFRHRGTLAAVAARYASPRRLSTWPVGGGDCPCGLQAGRVLR